MRIKINLASVFGLTTVLIASTTSWADPVCLESPRLSNDQRFVCHMLNPGMGPGYIALSRGIMTSDVQVSQERVASIVPQERREFAARYGRDLINRVQSTGGGSFGPRCVGYVTRGGDYNYFRSLFSDWNSESLPVLQRARFLPFTSNTQGVIPETLPYGELVGVEFVPGPNAVTAQLAQRNQYPLGICMSGDQCHQVDGLQVNDSPLARAVQECRSSNPFQSSQSTVANSIESIQRIDPALAADLIAGNIEAIDHYIAIPTSRLELDHRIIRIDSILTQFKNRLVRNRRPTKQFRAVQDASRDIARVGFQGEAVRSILSDLAQLSTEEISDMDRLVFAAERIYLSSLSNSQNTIVPTGQFTAHIRTQIERGL